MPEEPRPEPAPVAPAPAGEPVETRRGPAPRSVVEPVETPRRRRRVTTDATPGVDPTPASEPPRHREDENDARLREDKPPHY